jgi:hypothetical protein
MACFGVLFVLRLAATADEVQVVRIVMKADADGELAELTLDGKTIARPKDGKDTRFDVLQRRIRCLVEDSQGRRRDKAFEAELRYDSDTLKPDHVVAAITAISAYKSASDGNVVKLIERIRFVAIRRGDDP